MNRSLDHQQYCFVQKVDDERGDKKVYKTVARRCYERDEKNTENSMKSMYPFGESSLYYMDRVSDSRASSHKLKQYVSDHILSLLDFHL